MHSQSTNLFVTRFQLRRTMHRSDRQKNYLTWAESRIVVELRDNSATPLLGGLVRCKPP